MEECRILSLSTTTPESNQNEKSLLQEANDAKEEAKVARLRIVKLEKTAKWWSYCTAVWREKWGKVRAQRNNLREEVKIIGSQIKTLLTEYERTLAENTLLHTEVSKLRLEKRTAIVEPLYGNNSRRPSSPASTLCQVTGNPGSSTCAQDANMDINLHLTAGNESQELCASSETKAGNKGLKSTVDCFSICTSPCDKEQSLENRLNPFRSECRVPPPAWESLAIDHLLTEIAAEDKASYTKAKSQESGTSSRETFDHVAFEIIRARLRKAEMYMRSCQKIVTGKVRENGDLQMEVETLQHTLAEKNKLIEEYARRDESDREIQGNNAACRPSVELKLREMRSEIQRLQQENCCEWNRREQCESERQALQRDVKHYQEQVKELQDDVRKLTEQASNSQSLGMKLLQAEVNQKTLASAEMKSSISKLKKQLKDRNDEMRHESVRANQYEIEMKKLRKRIDELKKQLLNAEENADRLNNKIRRTQRTVDELSQQNEALQMQLQHASTRLNRRQANSDECPVAEKDDA